MKKQILHLVSAAAVTLALGLSSCTKDLDVTPLDPNVSPLNAGQLFTKCYANLALAGNGGANGDSDVDGIDGGTSGFVRQMWNSNELTTDEAICGWGDDGVAQFCFNTYDASHPMLNGYYSRLVVGITYCNQYINECGDFNPTMTAEVRFLRAFQYYLFMDAFGNVPFSTKLGESVRYTRKQMYDWLDQELQAIEPLLSDAKAKKSTDEGYGRVDKAACWLLQARLYLNAQVYTGTPQWQKAADCAKKVMNSSYKLNTQGVNGWSAYRMLFMGDNGETSAAYEAVFPLLQDGLKTTSWGTSLFLIASTADPDVHANPNDPNAINGTDQAWKGNRARPNLVEKFFAKGTAPNVNATAMAQAAKDDRALFDGVGRKIDNEDISDFKNGFAVTKFTNFRTDGKSGSSATYADADFFLLRSAEAYLTFAEATARLNGGITTAEGTAAVNALRARAHATQAVAYSLNDLLDEWSREFYFEGRRRVDLIRFGKFGGNSDYIWQWKGGSYAGRNFSAQKNIFAIPSQQLSPIVTQNPGY